MAFRVPGRVYGVSGAAGERSGVGVSVYTVHGGKIRYPVRIALDCDADEGLATVTVCVRDDAGDFVVDYESSQVCTATFRTWVRVVPKGAPAPAPTPGAVVWRQPDGSCEWLATDPLPDAAVAELNRAGRATAGATS